jgi:F0F1-type ATP synthase membrane subunit c/vacuolar-type H+-ATPase subunit K
MKKKLTDFEKEKKQIKFTQTRELVLFLLMTSIAFFGFIIVLIYLFSLIK